MTTTKAPKKCRGILYTRPLSGILGARKKKGKIMKSILIPIAIGLIVAFLTAAPASQARAEFFTGNDLATLLNSQSNSDRIQALGFIQGVFDVYVHVTICPPANVTAGQLNDMIRNYLNNNPAIRHHTAERLINQALKQVWPCQQRPQPSQPPGRGA